ncbi:MAG: class I SAM-dependent methyltransferase [Oligoflexia bacterium]|nr:class I SAM-dependent methyltransferase [Oligoflexia bacterium]
MRIIVLRGNWPKKVPILTEEQKRISDDYMAFWLANLRSKYGILDKFDHNFIVHASNKFNFISTLEIGCGIGEHIKYENLSPLQKKNYVGIDIRENMVEKFKHENKGMQAYVCDIQAKTMFEESSFDRIIAIHVLEHLPDLPSAIREIHRLIKKNGIFSIVIPCEGSFAYSIARKISSQRLFEKRYKMDYDWWIKSEHLSYPDEIYNEIAKYFKLVKKKYFPLNIFPNQHLNLVIGLSFQPILSKA